MEIYQLLKILSCKNKSKIISHFYQCFCNTQCVGSLESKLKITQSNLSKHMIDLLHHDILSVIQKHKKRYYMINQEFKNKYKFILLPLIYETKLKEYLCTCNDLKK